MAGKAVGPEPHGGVKVDGIFPRSIKPDQYEKREPEGERGDEHLPGLGGLRH